MNLTDFQKQRQSRNKLMMETDSFFQAFGALDDAVYAEGAISKKHKELMGLAISIATRCDECIAYHIPGCIDAGASLDEITEAIKIGVIGGGSNSSFHPIATQFLACSWVSLAWATPAVLTSHSARAHRVWLHYLSQCPPCICFAARCRFALVSTHHNMCRVILHKQCVSG